MLLFSFMWCGRFSSYWYNFKIADPLNIVIKSIISGSKINFDGCGKAHFVSRMCFCLVCKSTKTMCNQWFLCAEAPKCESQGHRFGWLQRRNALRRRQRSEMIVWNRVIYRQLKMERDRYKPPNRWCRRVSWTDVDWTNRMETDEDPSRMLMRTDQWGQSDKPLSEPAITEWPPRRDGIFANKLQSWKIKFGIHVIIFAFGGNWRGTTKEFEREKR